MESTICKVISYWRRTGTPWLPGVPEDEILSFERIHAVKLPPTLREFYATSNGLCVENTRGVDEEGYAFYELANVLPDRTFPWAFVFADYLIESWWLAISLKDSPESKIGAVYRILSQGEHPVFLAESFEEFLGLYITDDRWLYGGS